MKTSKIFATLLALTLLLSAGPIARAAEGGGSLYMGIFLGTTKAGDENANTVGGYFQQKTGLFGGIFSIGLVFDQVQATAGYTRMLFMGDFYVLPDLHVGLGAGQANAINDIRVEVANDFHSGPLILQPVFAVESAWQQLFIMGLRALYSF